MRRHRKPVEPLLRLLVFGAGGTGKSTLIASFDQAMNGKRVLILEAGGNPISIMDLEPEPVVVSITATTDLDRIYSFLLNQSDKHPLRSELGLPPDMEFGAVAFDTVTELQLLIMDELLNIKAKPTGFRKVQIQEWGDITGNTIHVVRMFRNLPLHLIVACQERHEYDDLTELTNSVPMIRGQGGEAIPAYADLACRLVRKPYREPSQPGQQKTVGGKSTIKTVAFFEPGTTWFAKNQAAPGLLTELVDPTGEKILSAVTKYFNTQKGRGE